MSLANPGVAFIGVARIWTVVVWVDHAVPFPTRYLVVFCACFRLISEHGGHRWSILVSQNRAQHPDLGFHVGVLLVGAMVARWLGLANQAVLTSGQGREGWSAHPG